MNKSNIFNPQGLIIARHRRMLSRYELAVSVGETVAHVGAIERGNSSPTNAEVEKYSEVLAWPIGFFYREHEMLTLDMIN